MGFAILSLSQSISYKIFYIYFCASVKRINIVYTFVKQTSKHTHNDNFGN